MIKNFGELLSNAPSEVDRKARWLALSAVEAAIREADPEEAVTSALSLSSGSIELRSGQTIPLSGRVFVVGAGKATGLMCKGVLRVLSDLPVEGAVNVPRGTEGLFDLNSVEITPAGHPLPDRGTLEGTRKIVEIAERSGEGDVLIALISGGGSALMELPEGNISLNDLRKMNDLLIKSGAKIQEINSVRKHVSRVKGGRLAALAQPASVVSLIISDVIGDPLDSIASGPTAPDPTTYEDAWEVIQKYGLGDDMPESILEVLKRGMRGDLPETPKPGDPVFENVVNLIVASNWDSLRAAEAVLSRNGVRVVNLGPLVEGEARHVGVVLASILRAASEGRFSTPPPVALLAGGETTVRVTGSGIGGRNQELVLGAVKKLAGLRGVVLTSVGTDGVDGVTEAAGALADGSTLDRAYSMGMDPDFYLENNDSNTFFGRLGDLVVTGPTLTNVMDVMVGVAL